MLSADFLITDVCLSVRFVADMKTCVFKNIMQKKMLLWVQWMIIRLSVKLIVSDQIVPKKSYLRTVFE